MTGRFGGEMPWGFLLFGEIRMLEGVCFCTFVLNLFFSFETQVLKWNAD